MISGSKIIIFAYDVNTNLVRCLKKKNYNILNFQNMCYQNGGYDLIKKLVKCYLRVVNHLLYKFYLDIFKIFFRTY